MKKLYIIILFCSLSVLVSHAQTTDYSYVRSRLITNSEGTVWKEHIDYDNGLGQIYQQVDVGVTPNHHDLVTLHEYDNYRRPLRTWLATPMSGSGIRSASTVKSAAQTYFDDGYPYNKVAYEQSPIEWLTEECKPGTAWQQGDKKTLHKRYVCGNSVLEAGIIHFLLVDDGTGYLIEPEVKCMIEECEDEEGIRTLTFKDREDRVCAVRRISQSEKLTTYYGYDYFGNLCMVLPPEAASYFEYEGEVDPNDEMMLKYGYEYRYDNRHNCIYKRLPGCEPVYYVYDKAGQCIFSQDGVQRSKGQWSYMIPDVFGRPAVTGICHNTLSYTTEPLRNVTVTASRNNATNRLFGHVISGVTLVSDTLVTATFYDDYSFIGHNGLTSSLNYVTPGSTDYGTQGLTVPRGLKTGSIMARLTDMNITSYDVIAQYYDDRGRVIQTKNRHFAEGYATEYMGYDFAGNVLKRKHVHYVSGLPSQTEITTMTYDHAGRLTQTTHQANNAGTVTVSANTYDELGRLYSVTRGGNLTTYYTYNIQSWPKAINTGTLFTESLYYNDSFSGNTPRYDGNITAMAWKADSKNRAFRYIYDKFARLDEATYMEDGIANHHFDEDFSYDKMGNIEYLVRHGLRDNNQYGVIDSVSIYYSGNQMVHADDGVSGPDYAGAFHFRDGSGTQPDIEYEYDQNGRMTKDFNKGILRIQYNLLNLPSKITFQDGGYIKYQYDASGMKQIVWGNAPGQGSKSQFYIGNYVYGSGGTVKQLALDGGFVTFNGTTPQYHYYLKDHLGNNRVVVNSSGTAEQVNHYYAYGALMGESTGGDVQDFKYNGKELDRLHGLDWYDYGARHYEAALGRWPTMDQLAEKYYDISPYVYCANRPINAFDPNGKEKIEALDPTRDYNQSIIKAVSNFKDEENVINIWAHGSPDGINIYDKEKGENVKISNSKDFKAFLGNNSKVWANRKEGEEVKIVLHSCKTGVSNGREQSFAQKISSDLNNTVVVAPNDDVYVANGHEIGVYNSSVNSKGVSLDSEKRWVQFEKGVQSTTYKGSSLPGSVGFKYVTDNSPWYERLLKKIGF